MSSGRDRGASDADVQRALGPLDRSRHGSSVTISGALTAGAQAPSGTVAISVGGASVTATIGAAGGFSAIVPTAGIAASSTVYSISFSYGGDGNFAAATGSSSLQVTDTTAPAIGTVSLGPNVIAVPDRQDGGSRRRLLDARISRACRRARCRCRATSRSTAGRRQHERRLAGARRAPGPRPRRALRARERPRHTITVGCSDASGNVLASRPALYGSRTSGEKVASRMRADAP